MLQSILRFFHAIILAKTSRLQIGHIIQLLHHGEYLPRDEIRRTQPNLIIRANSSPTYECDSSSSRKENKDDRKQDIRTSFSNDGNTSTNLLGEKIERGEVDSDDNKRDSGNNDIDVGGAINAALI